MKFSIFEQAGRAKPWGVRYWLNSSPIRTYYSTRAAAQARKDRLESAFATGGVDAVKRIDQDADVAEAKRLLGSSGLTLAQAVRIALSVHRGAPDGPTLQEASDGMMTRCAEINLRTKTVTFYNEQLGRFLGQFGAGKRVGAISREAVARYIAGRPVKSRPHALRALRAWFRWMRRQDPPLVPADPTEGMGIEVPRGGRAIAYLTAEESARLLSHAGWATAAVAVMLFAGVRSYEIYREVQSGDEDVLRWEDFDFEAKTILMRAAVSKTRVDRAMRRIPDNLWPWIASGKGKSGPVCDCDLRWHLGRARKAAGLAKWGKSILRHTFASHHVAAFEDLSATALILRHEGDVRLLNRHYREGVAITKADGRRYFEITPLP